MTIIQTLFILLVSLPAYPWGGRGHVSVCEASIHLLKNEKLKNFLLPRTYILGHLCIIPDADWRGLGKKLTNLGNPTHYLNSDSLSGISEVPAKFTDVLNKLGGPRDSAHKKAGSNWWRAEQFYRLAITSGKAGDIEGFIVFLGLMGHFIGDNGTAFHVVQDYDGFDSGHGGIHEYYESIVPGLAGPELVPGIVSAGLAEIEIGPSYLKEKEFLKRMKKLAEVTSTDVRFLLETDPVLKPSKGKKLATRSQPEKVFKVWQPVIVKAMARSALLMAHLMDQAYIEVGEPDLNKKKFFFPFRVPFVEPDYIVK